MLSRYGATQIRISRWQRWRSYLDDILLEKLPAPPEPSLELWLSAGRLLLATPNAIYSWEDRYTSFAGAFEAFQNTDFRPDSALVLGFGLGSIPILLDREYGLRPKVTGVEWDARVLSLVRRYLPPELLVRWQLLAADALDWVPNSVQQRFDLVCMDLFVDDQVPSGCSDPAFLAALRGRVAPQGWLFISRMRNENPVAFQGFQEAFSRAFPGATERIVAGNIIWQWQAEA